MSNTIEAVGFLPPTAPVAPFDAPLPGAPAAAGTQGAGDFGRWFTQHIEKVDGKLNVADRELQALATGQTQNLHQVMIALEEAKLSFQLLVQVRNRVLDAYQDVMRMQV